jgi:hypothetical protein
VTEPGRSDHNLCTECRTHGSLPPRGEQEAWSIGIYAGESPLALTDHPDVTNPVLTSGDVTDVSARSVADPFMLMADGRWHMFFEVMNESSGKGEIGLATSADGIAWDYERVVLAEPFHLSYPYVFEWLGDHYMVPESHQAGSVRLYRATSFPTKWSLVATLRRGRYLADASICRFGDKWWLFAETSGHKKHHTLRLYHADDLGGRWVEHSASPIVRGEPCAARPAGRLLVLDGQVVRFAQACRPAYGTDVRAFRVTALTVSAYEECPIEAPPVLRGAAGGWNSDGMHHVDAHELEDGGWIACVDGQLAPPHQPIF